MFGKIATTPSRKSRSPKLELPLTTAFATAIRDEGFRLDYEALAQAARILGEDKSTQILAQRGSTLVKLLPVSVQPFICRKSGGYAKGVEWKVETPSDLRDRQVVQQAVVAKAIKVWQKATKAAKA